MTTLSRCTQCSKHPAAPGGTWCTDCCAARRWYRQQHHTHILAYERAYHERKRLAPGPNQVACCNRWWPITQMPLRVSCCARVFFGEPDHAY